jgi:hypothetical protein
VLAVANFNWAYDTSNESRNWGIVAGSLGLGLQFALCIFAVYIQRAILRNYFYGDGEA